MNSKRENGRIVWHDLQTHDVEKAKGFYAELLGWEYQIEHAKEFAWNTGEGDYPLIVANGEAQGGFVDVGQMATSHWLAYVLVEDVNEAATKAETIGTTIARKPFDIPGVGRATVIRDTQGAAICPYLPTHDFPPPGGTFLWDELVTNDLKAAKNCYAKLFGWKAIDLDTGRPGSYTVFKIDDGINAAGVITRSFGKTGSADWVTYLATDNVELAVIKARKLGARVLMEVTDDPHMGWISVLEDPTGAVFGLCNQCPPLAECGHL